MKNTRTRTSKLDSILFRCEACYSQDFDESSIEVWHEALAEYDVDEISAAFTVHVKVARYLPTISEIIALIKHNRGPQLSIESQAQAEWRKVLTAVRQRGRSAGAPQFKNKITAHLVASQFNWIHLCEMEITTENWYEKRWCDAFALASQVDLNQLAIDAAAQVKKLAEGIGKIIK